MDEKFKSKNKKKCAAESREECSHELHEAEENAKNSDCNEEKCDASSQRVSDSCRDGEDCGACRCEDDDCGACRCEDDDCDDCRCEDDDCDDCDECCWDDDDDDDFLDDCCRFCGRPLGCPRCRPHHCCHMHHEPRRHCGCKHHCAPHACMDIAMAVGKTVALSAVATATTMLVTAVLRRVIR